MKDRTPNSAFVATPLHDAAEKGDMDACRKLLEEGCDVNALDENGWSPLIQAVQGDHVGTVRLLLGHGAKMEYSYQREDSPEERARKKQECDALNEKLRSPQIWDEFLQQIPPEAGDEWEEVRKQIEESRAQVEEMRKITEQFLGASGESIAAFPDDFMVEMHFGPQTEHAIGHCGSIPMLDLLVNEFHADINHVAGDGYFPLSTFAEGDDLPAVTWLLENGADPNTTSTGETAIFKAVSNDNLEMVKLFREYGARIDVQDCDGWTVLFCAKSRSMAEYLIAEGADPTRLDQCDFPCWHWTKDQATKDFLRKEAVDRGLKQWTEM